MSHTIFYAWQDDRPVDLNRYFIRDALSRAVERIGRGSEVYDSPRLDHDTKGISGTPEVARAVFDKIEHCSIFVIDLTFIAETAPRDEKLPKLIPNPNVLLELGYAAREIGWEAVICVMNTAFG